jgi:hypothetical protein
MIGRLQAWGMIVKSQPPMWRQPPRLSKRSRRRALPGTSAGSQDVAEPACGLAGGGRPVSSRTPPSQLLPGTVLPRTCDFGNLDYSPFRAHPKRDSALAVSRNGSSIAGIARNATTLLYRKTSGLLQPCPESGDESPWGRARCNANSHAWRGARTGRPPGIGGERCAGHFKLFFF